MLFGNFGQRKRKISVTPVKKPNYLHFGPENAKI